MVKIIRTRVRCERAGQWVLGAVLLASPCFGINGVDLSSSLPSPQPVGTSITWKAKPSGLLPLGLDYQFSVSSGASFQVVRDFSPDAQFVWTPSVREGNYTIRVLARTISSGDIKQADAPMTIVSRVSGAAPVVSATAHPLVALYSAPPCAASSSMYVVFTDGAVTNQTNTLACTPAASMNFYIAGMKASSTYTMHHVIQTGSQLVNGPDLPFTTDEIPRDVDIPSSAPVVGPGPRTSKDQTVVLVDNMGPSSLLSLKKAHPPTAYDMTGAVLWYYPGRTAPYQKNAYTIRAVPGGTFILHANNPKGLVVKDQIWREVDLAGNTIRETNNTRVAEQINRPDRAACTSFSHETIRLPNQHTLIICTEEKIFPAGTQGSKRGVDILGASIVDLDENLQVKWYWSGYDHLDISRSATLGEIVNKSNGFAPLTLASSANDWLHANSLDYINSSGDITISLRNQDWVLKLNYKNGTGDGTILWRLGISGDFTINSTDPYPWFSHQHDFEFDRAGTMVASLYDNGNTRRAQNPGTVQNSRGMALNVDEVSMVATPVLYADLKTFCGGGGSAQRLNNGDYIFHNAIIATSKGDFISQHLEVQPGSGTIYATINYGLQTDTNSYRSYRFASLYSGE